VFSVDQPGRRLGTVILDLRVDYLFPEDLAAERFGNHGQLAVVNRGDGEILFHSETDWIGQTLRGVDPQVAALLARDPEPVGGWTEIPGVQGGRIVSFANLDSGLEAVPWTVVATAFPREFTTEARRAGIINLTVASLALLLALAVLLASSRRISSSVQVVTRGAREIAAGNLGHAIQVHTHDEIQTLADTFNIMTASLRESIELREKAAEELAALNRTLEDRVHERTRELEALNEALNSANQELKELDRLKSNFLATVSHEFKTPLTSIKAFSEILLDETEERSASPETRRFLSIINTESERLARLIKNLLDLSRIEAGRMRWDRSTFPINEVLSAALDGLLPVFKEKEIRVVEEVECADVLVDADRDRIQQVITNLLENAVKFSRKSSRVWLSCRPMVEEGNGTPCLLIGIRDEGSGIPDDQLTRIFERFSQVDSTDTRGAGGSGLGLAISREIVEHHGGRIWAESTLGEGAHFLFTLPCQEGKNFPPPEVTKEMRHAEEGLGL
jgi:signal transduction histidine kinase